MFQQIKHRRSLRRHGKKADRGSGCRVGVSQIRDGWSLSSLETRVSGWSTAAATLRLLSPRSAPVRLLQLPTTAIRRRCTCCERRTDADDGAADGGRCDDESRLRGTPQSQLSTSSQSTAIFLESRFRPRSTQLLDDHVRSKSPFKIIVNLFGYLTTSNGEMVFLMYALPSLFIISVAVAGEREWSSGGSGIHPTEGPERN